MRLMLAIASAMSAFLVLTLIFFYATRKTYPGFRHWTAGVALVSSGYFLFALRGYIPESLSILLGNTAFPLGMVLHLDGIRRFLGLSAMSRLWYALPGFVLAAIACLYYLHDSPALRGMLNGVAISMPHWAMAALIFRHPLARKSMFFPVIGSMIGLAGFVVVARPIVTLLLPQWHLLVDSPFLLTTLGLLIVLQLGENLSLIILTGERVETELAEAEAEARMTVCRLEKALADRTRVEESLRESEERYRTFFDTSRDGVFITATDGRFVDFNNVALEMLGYSAGERSEVLGRNVVSFYAHPEDRDAHAAVVAEKGFSKEHPIDLRKKNGVIFNSLITTVARRDPWGHLIEFQGTVRDVTERKLADEALRESEHKFQTAFTNSPVAMSITSAHDEKYVDVNNVFLRDTGYTREEIIGCTSEELGLFVDFNDRERLISQVRARGHVYGMELLFRMKSGKQLLCLISTTMIRMGGRPHFLSSIVDISDRKRAEEEREALRVQLFQSQKMQGLGTLAGGIAHDFNNLLQVIHGYADLALMDFAGDELMREDLRKIIIAAESGSELVQRILSFSKHTEPSPVALDLNARIRRIREMWSRTFPKTIQISLDLADDLTPIHADPAQMDQILMNLAINAQEAMGADGTLTVATANITADVEFCAGRPGMVPGVHVMLSVSDTGKGMDRETRERMFDPFFTTKGWGSERGVGLGLSVLHGITDQHGGFIECFSEIGTGTTFKIYFPRHTADPSVEDARPGIIGDKEARTILLVDDEDLVRELGKRILTKAGYRVLTAGNGREALEEYRRLQNEIGLVILDLVMPEMSGKECLHELTKLNSHVKVIISSGHADAEDTRKTAYGSAPEIIRKPYNGKRLLEVVRRELEPPMDDRTASSRDRV